MLCYASMYAVFMVYACYYACCLGVVCMLFLHAIYMLVDAIVHAVYMHGACYCACCLYAFSMLFWHVVYMGLAC